MKLTLLAAALSLAIAPAAFGQSNLNPYAPSPGLYGTGSNPSSHYVQPHTNSNGTYVGGHYQTNPNNTQLDNYGTREM